MVHFQTVKNESSNNNTIKKDSIAHIGICIYLLLANNLAITRIFVLINQNESYSSLAHATHTSSPFTANRLGTHTPPRQLWSSPQGVPSAQGRLPLRVVHCSLPSSRHHNWMHAWSSGALGQRANSSPNACWHCWSRPNIWPGGSALKGIVWSGISSKQSPKDSIYTHIKLLWQ